MINVALTFDKEYIYELAVMIYVYCIYELLLINKYPIDISLCDVLAEVMKSLNIPKGVKRVLFRTLNTDRYVLSQYFMYIKMILEDNAVYMLYRRWLF